MDKLSKLKIFSLNVNSLVAYNRKMLFHEYVKTTNGDIFMISETKFNINSSYELVNFNVLRSDKRLGCGGVALIFKKTIKFRNVKKNNINSTIGFVSAELFVGGKWLRFISTYFEKSINEIDLKKITNSKLPFLIGGDMNARHVFTGDISSNYNGIKLKKIVENLNLNWIFTDGPTCFRSVDGSKIDHFILSNNFPFIFSDVDRTDSFSDHFGITISLHINELPSNSKLTVKLFNRTNIGGLNKYIESEFGKLCLVSNAYISNTQIDVIIDKIGNIFVEAIKKFVPTIEIRANSIILSKQTMTIRGQFHKISKKIFKNKIIDGGSIVFRDLLNEYRHLKTCYINSLSHDINLHYKNLLLDIESTYGVYGHIKKYTSYKKKTNCLT